MKRMRGMMTNVMQRGSVRGESTRTGAPVLLLLALSLAACGKKELPLPPAPPAETPPATPDTPAIEPQPGLSSNQRLARVVELLNAGDEPTARAELTALLQQDPGRREAEVIRQSVEGDPRAILPRDSFAYVIRPGDSFITLALEYLGDSYKFYALSRVNGILGDKLKPGDIVQIPGRFREPRRERKETRRTPPAAPRSTTPTPSRPEPATAPAAPQGDPAAARRMRRGGLESMSAGRIDQAVARLSRAAQLDPGDAAIAADLARARRIQSAVRGRN